MWTGTKKMNKKHRSQFARHYMGYYVELNVEQQTFDNTMSNWELLLRSKCKIDRHDLFHVNSFQRQTEDKWQRQER